MREDLSIVKITNLREIHWYLQITMLIMLSEHTTHLLYKHLIVLPCAFSRMVLATSGVGISNLQPSWLDGNGSKPLKITITQS